MATNFDFLKKVDTNLFEIISEAEKLYRDEYFEQCMGQTRRFGENVCKKVLGANRTTEKTFDDMQYMYQEVASGKVDYDVILVSDDMAEKMIKEELLQKINKDNINNFINLYSL